MNRRPAKRRDRARHRRVSLARLLARPAAAGRYPGYADPEEERRTSAFLTGSLLLHAAAIAVLAVIASLAPEIETRILHLRLLQETPPPPPLVVKPEPPPIEKTEPPPILVARPEPPRRVAKPDPLPPVAVPVPPRTVAVPKPKAKAPPPPLPQIDRVAAAPDAPRLPLVHRAAPAPDPDRTARPVLDVGLTPVPALAVPAAPAPAREVRERPEIAQRRSPPPVRAEIAPPPIAPVPAVAPPPRAAAQRPDVAPPRPTAVARSQASDARSDIRGVALGSLAPCVRDARELELKQRTVAAAGNRALCESPAGRFHFVETKNVNAFLMRIEQTAGRRSGDRCAELTLALDCLANSPRRSR